MKVVAAAVVMKNGKHGKKFLIVKRAPDPNFIGCWEFVGGKVNPIKDGGDPQRYKRCVVREAMEELEIYLEILEAFPPRVHDYGESSIGKVELHFFLCRIVGGFPRLKTGIHDAAAWVSVSELKNYRHLAGGYPIIEELCQRFGTS